MPNCRCCFQPLKTTFCDLGNAPLSNSYLKKSDQKEAYFPLHAYVCETCFLVQIEQFERPSSIFSEYLYFSSYSSSWLAHAKEYAEKMIDRFSPSYVVEIASNDGYLLQYFKDRDVLGIEPAHNVAAKAIEKGIPTLTEFFGREMAKKLARKADLLIANNVLAHIPDLHDFVAGLSILLAPSGILTIEFPHLLQLMEQNQFDTIYHEHFSYFSLTTAHQILERYGLEIFDVEELSTHGGSLRIYVQHPKGVIHDSVYEILEKEKKLTEITTYHSFSKQVEQVKDSLLEFLHEIKKSGKSIAAYGAPAKGNTLLNFCKISTDLIPFTVDISPHKQGCFLPGSRLPIYPPSKIDEVRPDYLVILPWNLKTEIMKQMDSIRSWGGKFVIPIPQLEIV